MGQESAAATQVIDAHIPIVDCHHHLWKRSESSYLIDDYARDAAGGHHLVASVFVECSTMYHAQGPAHLRSVGEAEFVTDMVRRAETEGLGPARICAAFIGGCDLASGDLVEETLAALAQASGGRLRGIRGAAAWDEDPSINTGLRPYAPRDLLLSPDFQAGVGRLSKNNLIYEAWQYFPQLPQLCVVADRFEDLPIVVNHCGGLLGLGRYAAPDNFARWKAAVEKVSRRPNVYMKVGGLSPRRCGFGFESRPAPASAIELAGLWRPYVETCIELFGAERCMFESNFPPDRVAGGFATIWNALKLAASACSDAEKRMLFCDNARDLYRI